MTLETNRVRQKKVCVSYKKNVTECEVFNFNVITGKLHLALKTLQSICKILIKPELISEQSCDKLLVIIVKLTSWHAEFV